MYQKRCTELFWYRLLVTPLRGWLKGWRMQIVRLTVVIVVYVAEYRHFIEIRHSGRENGVGVTDTPCGRILLGDGEYGGRGVMVVVEEDLKF